MKSLNRFGAIPVLTTPTASVIFNLSSVISSIFIFHAPDIHFHYTEAACFLCRVPGN
jgi:hypothetical protein